MDVEVEVDVEEVEEVMSEAKGVEEEGSNELLAAEVERTESASLVAANWAKSE